MTLRRRDVVTAGVAALGGAVVAGVGVSAATTQKPTNPEKSLENQLISYGDAVEPFYGEKQSGIATHAQAHASFAAFTLNRGTDRAAVTRMLHLLTDDAARLTRGEPALADTEAELAVVPARLTITFAFGHGLFRAAGLDSPVPTELPAFSIDRLQARWTGGDLLLQICADDPLTVAHAQRMLIKDARPFGTVRWVQQGFRRGRGMQDDTQTQRNVLGQLDGTRNPKIGAPEFDTAVWRPDHSTTLVVRRIRAEMETWDQLGRADKELAVGRKLDTGAPLTGTQESDESDFTKLDANGLPVMPDFAHVTRAHVSDDSLRILRRPYNYDGQPGPDGKADSGLIFAAYQADVDRQFVPIQRRLADRDLLNEWITPIGSAVFAVPPGCAEGGFVGDQLLT